MSLLTALQELGVPLVVATARTPRAIRKITGHEHLGRVVCANGAVLWDTRSGGVIWERGFEPTGLAAAVAGVREALPDAGVAPSRRGRCSWTAPTWLSESRALKAPRRSPRWPTSYPVTES